MDAVIARSTVAHRLGDTRILVVDDDTDVLELVRDVLSDEGYFVSTARHGAAALELAQTFRPHVILLDLRMPIMDGWSFVELYRRKVRPSASIILFSAVPEAGQIGPALRAEAVLQKPIDLDQMLRAIESCVADC